MDNKKLSSEALLSNYGDMTSFRYGNKLRFTTRDVVLQLGYLLFSSDDVLFHISLFCLKLSQSYKKNEITTLYHYFPAGSTIAFSSFER